MYKIKRGLFISLVYSFIHGLLFFVNKFIGTSKIPNPE